MRYRLLGRTGLRVSELCLGAMVFGDQRGGWGAPPEAAAEIVKRYADAGGNFIDTANHYAGGESERIVGEIIGPERDRWVLATKYTLSADPDDPNAGGSHRKSLRRAIDASLKRLGTDYIDLYRVHIWDAFTPIEEVISALDDIVRAGKVLYRGISDTPAWIVSQAVTLAEQRGLTPFRPVRRVARNGGTADRPRARSRARPRLRDVADRASTRAHRTAPWGGKPVVEQIRAIAGERGDQARAVARWPAARAH